MTITPAHHRPTAAAAGVLAVIVGDVMHEMIGHGIGCLVGGGIPIGWSTSWSLCGGLRNSVAANVIFQLGGNTVNLLAGASGLALARRAARGVDAWFLWCFGAMQLCSVGAYLMFDPLTGLGDFHHALRVVAPTPVVGTGVTLLGALVLVVSVPVAARGLQEFVRLKTARAEALKLVLLPWLLGGIGVMCVTAWIWRSHFPQHLAAALWFQGGCMGAVTLVPIFVRPDDAVRPRTIEASRAYLAAAVCLAVLSYVRLGAGIIYPTMGRAGPW